MQRPQRPLYGCSYISYRRNIPIPVEYTTKVVCTSADDNELKDQASYAATVRSVAESSTTMSSPEFTKLEFSPGDVPSVV